MKKVFTLFIALFCLTTAQAQLADGSYAPNFTGTDINGNTWNLYDLLDSGKSVVLDVSATWCGPCWGYHQTGALDDVYHDYGPDGTNEMMVLWVEGDPNTGMDDIVGKTASSQGDWTSGTSFPIIDDNTIADLYEIGYYPTIYFICESRTVTEAGQLSAAELYALRDNCPTVSGVNNTALLVYNDFEGAFCESLTLKPVATFQNLGSDNVTSASFQLSLNGMPTETVDWEGDLSTYQASTVTFGNVTVTEDTDISIDVMSVNGAMDEDASNNLLTAQVTLAPTTNDNLATLTLTTDQYPQETYWELLDGNGTALYTGGNSGIFNGTLSPNTYDVSTTYTHELTLPADGCFEFVIYDLYGDGICCAYGEGAYVIADQMGNAVVEGGTFENIDNAPFELSGGTDVLNNSSLVNYTGPSGDFCFETTFEPVVAVQNLGANDITSMDIEARNGADVLQSFAWTGTIAPGGAANVTMNELTLTESTDLTFHVINVNGVADDYAEGNDYGTVSHTRAPDAVDVLALEIEADGYGCEFYWEFRDVDNGTVIASGGNPAAVAGSQAIYDEFGGCDGQPGYANNSVNAEVIEIPANGGCYEFNIIDDYGDGFFGSGGYTITDAAGNVLAQQGTGNFAEISHLLTGVVVAVEEVENAESWNVFPNPAQDIVRLEFELTKQMPLNIDLYNTLGKRIQTIANQDFGTGTHSLSADVSQLPNGLYYISAVSGSQTTTHKFVINK